MGELDPDAMRQKMSPRLFRRWLAASLLGLDGEGWNQAGEVAAMVHNKIQSALSAYAGKDVAEDDLVAPFECTWLSRYLKDEDEERVSSIEKFQQQVKRKHGNTR